MLEHNRIWQSRRSVINNIESSTIADSSLESSQIEVA